MVVINICGHVNKKHKDYPWQQNLEQNRETKNNSPENRKKMKNLKLNLLQNDWQDFPSL